MLFPGAFGGGASYYARVRGRFRPFGWRSTFRPDTQGSGAHQRPEAAEQEHRRHVAGEDRARAIYLGDEDERWDGVENQVRRYTDYVRGEINRLNAARSEPSRS